MYELKDVIVSKMDIVRKNGRVFLSIDEDESSHRLCAVDEESEVAIDIHTRERYTYLKSHFSGLYIFGLYSTNPDDYYAIHATSELINVTEKDKILYQRVVNQENRQKTKAIIRHQLLKRNQK